MDGDPYQEATDRDKSFLNVESLDNGRAIIIFDNGCQSSTDALSGCAIMARGEAEARWRRLTHILRNELMDNEAYLAAQLMSEILRDIFSTLADQWKETLRRCSDQVSILEDQVYESPAEPDETRAASLWTNASLWLTLEKLLGEHSDVQYALNSSLAEVVQDTAMKGSWVDFQRLEKLIQEDIIKPTAAMYKSVAYRDSRISLKLNASLWRLSWITFIFLPFTFLVSFFGMNVDTFENNPSIKWYFVAAVCLMAFVFICWYYFKYSPGGEQPIRQRRLYEIFHRDLAETYPQSWTRHGPRADRIPSNWVNRLKWRLLTSWYAPHKLPPKEWSLFDSSGIGMRSRLKLSLTRRWLAEIPPNRQSEPLLDDVELGLMHQLRYDGGIASLLEAGTQVMAAVAVPSIKVPIRKVRNEEN
ncbi:hypothetical protein BDV96DRAFT_634593 [Lophiotrema nucula]|uniref:Cora-like Mg2+ transporter protein-domain-containing protein n=1 Tax=Lophiotrema nucula TaxID=690887 RepID=A0A6A5YXL5_9PLEO|nr:hypothetical protein BDV96DRAFT_634593 [Lophiotrema nucula]